VFSFALIFANGWSTACDGFYGASACWLSHMKQPLPLPSDHLCLVVTFFISVTNLAFSPRIWACFSVELRVFFEDLRVACFWACFNWNLLVFWACFLQSSVLQIAFFPVFMALLPFQFTAKGTLGMFLWKFAHFALVFCICHPDFMFDFLADFLFCWIFLCCNLSRGVALIVWFTTNGMCVKNNTIICVARASNNKRDCEHDLCCCLLPRCEALRTVRSFLETGTAHGVSDTKQVPLTVPRCEAFEKQVPLGISDSNTCQRNLVLFFS